MSGLLSLPRWAARRENRWFVLALVVGLALRLSWVLWATADPSSPFADTAQHLSMADQFSRFQSYRLNGELTAYHAPGYPFLLTPVAALSRWTGAFSLTFAAALVNVVAGTVTIALGADLARRWVSERARTPTAWILAVAAGPIYLTSIALNETVHTAVILAVLVLLTAVVQGQIAPDRLALVGLGALIGCAVLVRSSGAVLLIVAIIGLRVVAGSWRAALRPTAVTALVAMAVAAPWVVRNGVQVGVWAPSANAAAFLCHGHGDRAQADEVDLSDEDISRCFVGTAYGPDPDEGRWYGETIDQAIDWAISHPREEMRLTIDKTLALYGDDSQALADAADFGSRELAGPDTTRLLDRLADGWHRIVLVLALVGFVLCRDVRRAWPLWTTVVGLTMVVWAGSVLDRYHHAIMAILAVFASATLVLMGRWAGAGIRSMREQDGPEEPASPPPADEGLAQATRSRSPLAGPNGHPFHPFVASVAIGAWVFSFGFDLISQVADTEWAYARAAWVLIGGGVAVGLVAAALGLIDLLGIPRGTKAFGTGIRHLLLMDTTLVLFTVSLLIRNSSEFRFHDSVDPLPMALSAVGLITLSVGGWLGGKLAYTYGVRVALDDVRQEGFEPRED